VTTTAYRDRYPGLAVTDEEEKKGKKNTTGMPVLGRESLGTIPSACTTTQQRAKRGNVGTNRSHTKNMQDKCGRTHVSVPLTGHGKQGMEKKNGQGKKNPTAARQLGGKGESLNRGV